MIVRSENGQGLVEYGLILSLIMVLAVAALALVSGTVNDMLSNVGAAI